MLTDIDVPSVAIEVGVGKFVVDDAVEDTVDNVVEDVVDNVVRFMVVEVEEIVIDVDEDVVLDVVVVVVVSIAVTNTKLTLRYGKTCMGWLSDIKYVLIKIIMGRTKHRSVLKAA